MAETATARTARARRVRLPAGPYLLLSIVGEPMVPPRAPSFGAGRSLGRVGENAVSPTPPNPVGPGAIRGLAPVVGALEQRD